MIAFTQMPCWRSGSAPGSGGPPPSLFVSVSPSIAVGYTFYDGSPPAPVNYSGEVTAVGHGGTPPYTYAWTEVDYSGDGYTYPSGITVASPTSAATRFKNQDTSVYSLLGWFVCTVTDSLAVSAVSPEVEVQLEQDT
jgi:hypothetical protein